MPHIFLKARDPISSYSHFIGAGLSLLGLAVMILHLAVSGPVSLMTVISTLLFCLSLIALYSASGFYHFSRASARIIALLRKLDHAMIYVLIAGTYTPVLLNLLPPTKAILFTSAIWAVALGGIVMKLCWINAPRWLGTSLYLLLGWAILIDLPAVGTLPAPGIALLLAGGLCYTFGGVIYMLKHPNFSKTFGFHELFHIFVILGSMFHYFMVLFFIA